MTDAAKWKEFMRWWDQKLREIQAVDCTAKELLLDICQKIIELRMRSMPSNKHLAKQLEGLGNAKQ